MAIVFTIFGISQLSLASGLIRIESEVYLGTSKTITLGDIASFHGIPQGTVDRLSSVPLGNAPEVGHYRIFTSGALSLIFRKLLPQNLSQKYRIKIPKKVFVRGSATPLKNKNLESYLVNEWKKLCPKCEFKFQRLDLPANLRKLQLVSWHVDTGAKLSRGSFSLPIYMKGKNGQTKTSWVKGVVKIYKRVPMAKRSLVRREAIREQDITLGLRDITFSQDATSELQNLIGKRISQQVKAGEIIWQRFLLREKILRRGEFVKAFIGEPHFEVSILGRVENDAYVGDKVRVRNMNTNKLMSGWVTSKGEVKLQ